MINMLLKWEEKNIKKAEAICLGDVIMEVAEEIVKIKRLGLKKIENI
jgi:hypothetical protein